MKSMKNTGVTLHTVLQPNWLGEYCRGRDGRPVRKHPIAPVNIRPFYSLNRSLPSQIRTLNDVPQRDMYFVHFFNGIFQAYYPMRMDFCRYGFPLLVKPEMATADQRAPPYHFNK